MGADLAADFGKFRGDGKAAQGAGDGIEKAEEHESEVVAHVEETARILEAGMNRPPDRDLGKFLAELAQQAEEPQILLGDLFGTDSGCFQQRGLFISPGKVQVTFLSHKEKAASIRDAEHTWLQTPSL